MPGAKSKAVTQTMRCGGPTEGQKQITDFHLRAPGEHRSSKDPTFTQCISDVESGNSGAGREGNSGKWPFFILTAPPYGCVGDMLV